MRGLIVVLLIAGLLGLIALGPRWFGGVDTTYQDNPEPPGRASCQPLLEPCTWQVAGETWQVAMATLEDDRMRLTLSMPSAAEEVVVILTGETMYMGEYPMRMRALEQKGRYRVEFVPPFCTIGPGMVWHPEFRVDGERLTVPLNLRFSVDDLAPES